MNRRSILPRLVALLVGLILVVSLFLMSLLMVLEHDRQRSTLQKSAKAAADYLEENLTLPIWDLGFSAIEAQLDAAMLDRAAYGIELSLYGIDHPPIYRARDTDWGVIRAKPLKSSAAIEQTNKISHNGKPIASIVVYYTDRFARDDLLRESAFLSAIIMAEAATLIFALVLALRSSVFRPLWSIESWAERVSRGEKAELPAPRGGGGEIESLRSSIGRMISLLDERYEEIVSQDRELREVLAIKENLAKELFHRTRNNIQVISSLIALREAGCDDEKESRNLRDIEACVEAIALAQEELYKSEDLSCLDLGSYLRALAYRFLEAGKGALRGPQIVVEANTLSVTIDLALPLGLIVTELLFDLLERDFPDGECGRVELSLERKPRGRASIRIESKDASPRPGFGIAPDAAIGFKAIEALVAQVKGSIEFDYSAGFACEINFPEILPGVGRRV